MAQEFKDVIDIFDGDKIYCFALNEVAIQITEIDLNKESDHSQGYVTRLSFLNRKCHTSLTMNEFREVLEMPFEDMIKEFARNFVGYFKDDTSSHKLKSSLHTLYAYSLGFIPKPTMTISQTIHRENEAIVFQINMIKQEVYAFEKGFLKTLFNTEKELGYDFLKKLIGNIGLSIKLSDYYKKGITTNSPQIQEYLNNYTNER